MFNSNHFKSPFVKINLWISAPKVIIKLTIAIILHSNLNYINRKIYLFNSFNI